MKRRRPDPRRVKIHRSYQVAEIARLLGVNRNTVRNWIKQGLRAVDGRRPALFTGAELRRFLTEKRARRKRPTPPGQIYCLPCREPRRPSGDMADYLPRTVKNCDLKGICPVCDRWMYRRVRLQELEQVRAGLDVQVTKPDGLLQPPGCLSVNHDSATTTTGPANAQCQE